MNDVELILGEPLKRAVDLFPARELVTKLPDGSTHRYTYVDAAEWINQLAGALDDLGLEADDHRWNPLW
ncbi:hypothetical protein [Natrinema altunense]|uniref:AMP-dependent synthetase and ligase n=1 Tax=Natrinema altunense (strain JCM 12890 / CGMCC 1.3731 / AJ2) TaxID=1227494 RepID=L9ZGP7_NATA2|nr:hypothetical protein [Natrinema altunense]ELY84348.1 AMP-dependent synthetase and ligase [Natrinema altunense JCM 12890]